MSYVGRVSNPSGLTMESQRGPAYSMEKKGGSPVVKVAKQAKSVEKKMQMPKKPMPKKEMSHVSKARIEGYGKKKK
jgi:hypothetical protein